MRLHIRKYLNKDTLIGLLIGSFLFSGSAVALNNYVADNTPENGYLLCANSKTKAVTFPNKLSCPSGSIALDLGAVTGVQGDEGPQGIQGPSGPQGIQGPSGASATSKLYTVKVAARDIVFDGNATNISAGKRTILAVIDGTKLEYGVYVLRSDLSGLWSSTAYSKNPLLSCFFQEKADYDLGSAANNFGSRRYGEDRQEYGSWTGIKLDINGDAIFGPGSSPTYLVCVSTGSISGLGGSIWAQKLSGYGDLTLGQLPTN